MNSSCAEALCEEVTANGLFGAAFDMGGNAEAEVNVLGAVFDIGGKADEEGPVKGLLEVTFDTGGKEVVATEEIFSSFFAAKLKSFEDFVSLFALLPNPPKELNVEEAVDEGAFTAKGLFDAGTGLLDVLPKPENGLGAADDIGGKADEDLLSALVVSVAEVKGFFGAANDMGGNALDDDTHN